MIRQLRHIYTRVLHPVHGNVEDLRVSANVDILVVQLSRSAHRVFFFIDVFIDSNLAIERLTREKTIDNRWGLGPG